MQDWAEYLCRQGGFAAFGTGNTIAPTTHFTDPGLTRIGNNVHMSGAAFVTGDDASVNVISEAFDLCLINKGPITLGDNIFIGYGAIILPNVGIGAAHAAVMTDKPAAMARQERIRMDQTRSSPKARTRRP